MTFAIIKSLVGNLSHQNKLYHILRLVSSTLGAPCFTSHYLKQQVAEEELPVCSQFTVNRYRKFRLGLVLIYIIYVCKNIIFLGYTLSSVDFVHVSQNLRPQMSGDLNQFVCLVTNCSRSTPDLAEQIIKLPMFSICKRNIRWLYNPLITADVLGLVAMSAMTFWVLTMQVIAPIFVTHFKTCSPTVLTMIAPSTSAKQTRQKIYKLWIQSTESLLNHLNIRSDRWQHYHDSLIMREDKLPMEKDYEDIEFHANVARCRLEKLEQLRSTDRFDNKHLSPFMSDCLPINTTNWWISGLASSFLQSQVLILYMLASGTAMVQISILKFTGIDYKYSELDRVLQENNCSVWAQDDLASGNTSGLDLNDAAVTWNAYTIFEQVLVLALPLYEQATVLNMFYHSGNDIKMLLKELDMQLKLAVEFTRLRALCRCVTCCDQTSRHSHLETTQQESFDEQQVRFPVKQIGEKLIACTQFIGPLVITRELDIKTSSPAAKTATQSFLKANLLESKIAYQKLAGDLLTTYGCAVDTQVEFLEKIQVNYRYFMDYLEEFNEPLSMIFAVGYAINYGFALVSVYFYLNVKRMVALPLIVTSMAVVVANAIIAWASSVHSNARKLEPMFWDLISQTCNQTEERMIHLRARWLKQLQIIDNEGGLALKAFNMRISYVGIIQVLIWTSSILLLACIRA